MEQNPGLIKLAEKAGSWYTADAQKLDQELASLIVCFNFIVSPELFPKSLFFVPLLKKQNIFQNKNVF